MLCDSSALAMRFVIGYAGCPGVRLTDSLAAGLREFVTKRWDSVPEEFYDILRVYRM